MKWKKMGGMWIPEKPTLEKPIPATPLSLPKPISPLETFQHDQTEYQLHLSQACFVYLTKWFLENPHAEVSGYGIVHPKEDGHEMVMAYLLGSGGGGDTHIGDENSAWAAQKAFDDGFLTPESYWVQWHTHPGMRTFWSGVDESDQGKTVRQIQYKGESGKAAFLVFDELEYLTRYFEWDGDGKTLYRDGVALLLKQPLESRQARWENDFGYYGKYDYLYETELDAEVLLHEVVLYFDSGEWKDLEESIVPLSNVEYSELVASLEKVGRTDISQAIGLYREPAEKTNALLLVGGSYYFWDEKRDGLDGLLLLADKMTHQERSDTAVKMAGLGRQDLVDTLLKVEVTYA